MFLQRIATSQRHPGEEVLSMIKPIQKNVALDNDEHGNEADSLKDWLMALPELHLTPDGLVDALNNNVVSTN